MGALSNREIESDLDLYVQAWASTLADLLSRLSPAAWQPEPVNGGAEFVPHVRVRVSLGTALDGQQWVNFGEADVTELLRIVRNQESAHAELGQPEKEAIVDLMQQWAVLAASSLAPAFEKSSLLVALEEPAAKSGVPTRMLHVSDGSKSISAEIEIDEVLAHSLSRRASAAASSSAGRIEELVRQGNLELLMDVELGVMLQFGCRQATLREVLELATGAVLELDREVDQPVDLLLHGRVVARGEVVVIDGNYGLRVTEVATPQQRMGTL